MELSERMMRTVEGQVTWAETKPGKTCTQRRGLCVWSLRLLHTQSGLRLDPIHKLVCVWGPGVLKTQIDFRSEVSHNFSYEQQI